MLAVNDLVVTDRRDDHEVVLTGPMTFAVQEGEIFGIVGESGSGKTMTALALMRLLPRTSRLSGQINLDGRDIAALTEKQMRQVRGAEIGMVFQEPVASLNPVFTLGEQLRAAISAHHPAGERQLNERAMELLRLVGIPDPETRLQYYPHQLSGGMCQRVSIAMALASGAKLLIADEATTALDVTIQAEIVKLIERLVAETRISVIFISHDLGLVAQLCHRVAVVYAGEIVEIGSAETLLNQPRHPYTKALVRCVPDLHDTGVVQRGIPGAPPLPGTWPEGCHFQARCTHAAAACASPQPLVERGTDHLVRCCRCDDLVDA